jgi:hypothetical protein
VEPHGGLLTAIQRCNRAISATFTAMWGRVTGTVVLVVACLLGGCGGDDGNPEEKKVRAALTDALTTSDPLACTTLMTPTYVRQYTTEKTTDAARRACRKNLADDRARSVSIARVDLHGSRAEAVFSTHGGVLPYTRATVALRRSEGAWQLHRLTRATLDRPVFFTALNRDLRTGPDRVEGPIVDCTLRALKEVSDTQIVDHQLAGDLSFILTPTTLCTLRISLVKGGFSETKARCITRRVARALRGRDGKRFGAELQRGSTPRFERLVTRMVRRCS